MAKKKAAEEKTVPIQLAPDVKEERHPNRFYSNFIQVQHSPYDFTLRFCDATPIYDMDLVIKEGGNHRVPVIAEAVIPIEVFPLLIKAMTDKYKQYQDIYGKDPNGKKS